MSAMAQDERRAEAGERIDPELTAVEARYLHDVGSHLGDLPRADRTALLAVVREHLSDRPAAAHRGELLEAVGAPSAYAKRLRAEHGLPDRLGVVARVGRWPRRAKAAGFLAVAVVVAGLAAYSWWVGQEATLGDHCGGYDPGEGIEWREAAGVREARVPHRDGEELRVALCLYTDRDITVTGIRLPFDIDFVRLAAVDVAAGPGVGVPPFTRFEQVALGSTTANPEFWLVLAFGDCQSYQPGGGVGIDSVLVDYELLGRSRTAEVPLSEQITVVASGPPRCP